MLGTRRFSVTNIFEMPGKFYRGNLHTHSNRSDGVLEPEEVCRRYHEEGYDFIALTDHFIGLYDYPITDTKPFRTKNFTTILGAELHSGSMQNGELWHILAVGLPRDFKPSNSPDFSPIDDQETGSEITQRAVDAGAYVAIAHPQWSGLTIDDALSLGSVHAVEIYNHGCEVDSDRADGWHTLDLLLSQGKKLSACATDDAHFDNKDHFGGWVMVKANANEPQALLDALKLGAYYSSQGPEIKNLIWQKECVEVHTSSVCTVIVQGQGYRTVNIQGESMTRTIVPLERVQHSPWLRVTLIDRAGKKAWSNPVWRDN